MPGDASDFFHLGRDLRAAAVGVGVEGARAADTAVEAMQEDAQAHAPVESGEFRDSITGTVDARGLVPTGSLSSDVDYAPFVEFGTSRMAPQPTLGPAFDRGQDAFVREADAAIGRLL